MTSWKMIVFLSIVTVELLVVFFLLNGYINNPGPAAEINTTTINLTNVTVTPTPIPSGWYYDPEKEHFVKYPT